MVAILRNRRDWNTTKIANRNYERLRKSSAVAVSLLSTIADLYVWLDAESTFVKAVGGGPISDGDPVETWEDRSGNGRDYTQSTGSERPIWRDDELVRFDGVADNLDGPDFSSLTAAEAFILVKIDADPPPSISQSGIWTFGTHGINNQDHFPFTDGAIYDGFGSDARKTTGNPTADLSTKFRVYNVTTISGEWTSRIDGTQHFTTGTNTVDFVTATNLGASVDGAFLDGDIKHFAVYSRKLTTAERTSALNFLLSEI